MDSNRAQSSCDIATRITLLNHWQGKSGCNGRKPRV